MKKIIVIMLSLLSVGMCYAQAKKAKDSVPKTNTPPPPVKTPPTAPKLDEPMKKAISISSGGGGVSIRPPQPTPGPTPSKKKPPVSPKPTKDSMKIEQLQKELNSTPAAIDVIRKQ
jgi:hypothetical protein